MISLFNSNCISIALSYQSQHVRSYLHLRKGVSDKVVTVAGDRLGEKKCVLVCFLK